MEKAKTKKKGAAGSQMSLLGGRDEVSQETRERGLVAISQADERAIIEAAQGQMASDYVYSYTQGNQTVTGISYPGFLTLYEKVFKAPHPLYAEGLGPTIELVKDDPRGPTLVATCVVVHPKNSKIRIPAFAEQSVFLNPNDGSKRGNFHARAVVYGKLVRNAIKGLIPQKEAAKFLAMCLSTKGVMQLKDGTSGGGGSESGAGRRTRLAQLFSMAQSNGVDVNKDAMKKRFIGFLERQLKKRLSDCDEVQLAAMVKWLDENLKRSGKAAFVEAVEAVKL